MGKKYERDVSFPAREPSLVADWALPLLLSLTTGLLSGAVVVLIVEGSDRRTLWAVAAGVSLVTWLLAIGWMRESLWHSESVSEVEGDAVVTSETVTVPIRLEVEAERTLTYLELPGLANITQLRTFASMCLSGDLGERDARALLGVTGREWSALRSQMVDRGFLEWRGSTRQQGVSLTGKGEALARSLLEGETRLLTDGG